MGLLEFVPAGMLVGLAYGAFGAGGSAFATPVLALLGLPGVLAVATPLPAMLPASLAGASSYRRSRDLDWRTVRLTLAGAVPATLVGGTLARAVGGHVLLLLSGLLLAGLGVRMLWPTAKRDGGAADEQSPPWLVTAGGASIGFLAGLLANGGGFLLVPFFAVGLGMSMRRAAGTSLVTAAALALPTTLVHAFAGNIDWAAAAAFAVGLVPAAAVGGRLSARVDGATARVAFGALLVAFALWFLIRVTG
ncbi:MAG: sulfite exporter TauE/SafE family protein [Actinobacteria bacterium]|nr:sulfite exporter TauE/SafE family protein [Actinomycetota bacterium]MBV8960518.1 sulfite exporter TauE/SafE family protein [Actinomycetota bacterium]MBV9255598.1 sulfite exporter TauE/SafE family protein [Actinomycetota bacterium]MBV9935805.1 sulfite exporter TauE/SafE family protein [Actinomycetota bacterium]